MPNCADVTIRIVNFDDLVNGGQAIIELCSILGISSAFQIEWLNQYLSDNIKIDMEV